MDDTLIDGKLQKKFIESFQPLKDNMFKSLNDFEKITYTILNYDIRNNIQNHIEKIRELVNHKLTFPYLNFNVLTREERIACLEKHKLI